VKLVITSDTHFPVKHHLPEGDVLIVAGDIMYSGGPEEWQTRVEWLAAQRHKTKIYVPGNHDYHVEVYEGVAVSQMRRAGVQVLGLHPERAVTMLGDIKVLGLPWVTGLPGWAFNRDETWVRDYMDAITELHGYPDIIVSHAPMYGMRDAVLPEQSKYKNQQHVGCRAYNHWFHTDTTKRPKVWINGHIHESYGEEVYEDTRFINACMCDRNYEQTNEPFTIEV
jgi:Icc-related predicted phosphoesterase